MKNLAAEIKTGHRERTARLGELRGATKDILSEADGYMKRVAAELKDAARDLRASLEKGEAARRKDFEGLMGDIRARIKDITGDIKNLLAKSEEQRMAGFKDLMRDIKTAIKDAATAVEEIRTSTQSLLGEYKTERGEAAGYWAKIRARGERAETEEAAEAAPRPRRRGRRKKG